MSNKIKSNFNPDAIFPKDDFYLLEKRIQQFQESKPSKPQVFYKLGPAFAFFFFALLFAFLYYKENRNQQTILLTKEIYKTKIESKYTILNRNTVLSTTSNQIQIEIDHSKIILLNPNSTLIIKNDSIFLLKTGSLYGYLKPHTGKMKILFQNYQANVIGTKFFISNSQNLQKVYVWNGHIRLKTKNKKIEILDKTEITLSSNHISTRSNQTLHNMNKILFKFTTRQNRDNNNQNIEQKPSSNSNKKTLSKNKIQKRPVIKVETWGRNGTTSLQKNKTFFTLTYKLTNTDFGEVGIWIPKKDIQLNSFYIKLNISPNQYGVVCFENDDGDRWLSKQMLHNKNNNWRSLTFPEHQQNWTTFSNTQQSWKGLSHINKVGFMIMGDGDNKFHSVLFKVLPK